MRRAETERREVRSKQRRSAGSWRMAALGVVTLVSALAVVILSYQNRILYRAWQAELAGAGNLEVEWRRLLLEESAWLGHARIETVARDTLGMTVPRGDRIVPLRVRREER